MGGHVDAPDVRCHGLSIGFDGVSVLDHLDLVVEPGSITTLVGASGSGKSTLLRHILGLLPPERGTVTIGGRDVWDSSEAELREVRQNTSALLSGSTLFDGSAYASLTIRENLLAVLYERHANATVGKGRAHVSNPYFTLWTPGAEGNRRAIPAELTDRADTLLERFDLNEVADLLPVDVAARLRRRTGLACALAVDVPLYILDDPDGAIDGPHRRMIIDTLRETHARTGATMLISTHDLDLAESISDRMAVLATGRIMSQGEPGTTLEGLEGWYMLEDEYRSSGRAVAGPIIPGQRRASGSPPATPLTRLARQLDLPDPHGEDAARSWGFLLALGALAAAILLAIAWAALHYSAWRPV